MTFERNNTWRVTSLFLSPAWSPDRPLSSSPFLFGELKDPSPGVVSTLEACETLCFYVDSVCSATLSFSLALPLSLVYRVSSKHESMSHGALTGVCSVKVEATANFFCTGTIAFRKRIAHNHWWSSRWEIVVVWAKCNDALKWENQRIIDSFAERDLFARRNNRQRQNRVRR